MASYLEQYDKGIDEDWISASALQLLELCGMAFLYKYIYRWPEATSPDSIRGQSVHYGREINLSQKIESQEDMSLAEVTDATADHAKRLFSETEVLKGGADQYKKNTVLLGEVTDDAIKATEADYDTQKELKPVAVEQKLACKVEGLKRVVVGKIDTVTEGGVVRDLKTTRTTWSQEKADKSEALTTYHALYEAKHGKPPSSLVIDNVVVQKKQVKSLQLTTKRTEAEVKRQFQRFVLAQNVINKGAFMPCPRDFWKCSPKYCGFFQRCPYGAGR